MSLGPVERLLKVTPCCLIMVLLGFCVPAEAEPQTPGDPAEQGEPVVRRLSLDDLGSDGPDLDDPADAGNVDGFFDEINENLRLSVDVGSRFKLNIDTDDIATLQFAGIDALKVFSDDTGDFGTLLAQVYLTRIDNYADAPRWFEDEDDWDVLYKNLNFNYTGLGHGKFNIRVGHFELPYGLEVTQNTQLTLRQFTNDRNLGLVRDWGVSVNGDLPEFEYEVSLTRGSANELSARGDPWALTGRIGTPREEDIVLGFSAFTGDIQIPARGGLNTMERWRVGVDGAFALGQFGLLGQASVGENWNMEFYDFLVELNWHDTEQQWYVYAQGVYEHREYMPTAEDYMAVYLGVSYMPDTKWTLSGQYKQYLDQFHSYPDDGYLTFQVRYRF